MAEITRETTRWIPYQGEKAKKLPFKAQYRPKVKRSTEEATTQMRLVNWARSNGFILISIPNAGKRSLWLAQKEKAMGLTAGVSDLFLAMPSNGYHGFWLELKALGKKPTEAQLTWLRLMQERGYKAAWFDTYEKAKEAIEKYLKPGYPSFPLAA